MTDYKHKEDDHECMMCNYKKDYASYQYKEVLMHDIDKNMKKVFGILEQLKTHGVVDDEIVQILDEDEEEKIMDDYSRYEMLEKIQHTIFHASLLARWKQLDDLNETKDNAVCH